MTGVYWCLPLPVSFKRTLVLLLPLTKRIQSHPEPQPPFDQLGQYAAQMESLRQDFSFLGSPTITETHFWGSIDEAKHLTIHEETCPFHGVLAFAVMLYPNL